MKRLAIIGSGDLGRLIAFHAKNDHHYNVVGFFDDYAIINSNVDGYPILGKTTEVIDNFSKGNYDYLIIAIG